MKRLPIHLILWLLLISLPYLYAWQAAGDDYVFTGALLNPLDTATYHAKLYQGWRGDWLFTLPFTADPGSGTPILLFYLALGHLARLTHLPLMLVFHLARLLAAIVLYFSLKNFIAAALPQEHRQNALLLALFGSGLGWLVAFLGAQTADLWVAEAYPFLSAYINPHFPLSLALLLYLLNPTTRRNILLNLMLTLLLTILSPFGGLLALGICGAGAVWVIWSTRRLPALSDLASLFALAVGALPLSLYYLWLTRVHPQLAAWNAQNLTPAPPLWDTLLAFAPPLLLIPLSLPYLRAPAENSQQTETRRLILIWLLIALVLLYAPIGLQRRFLMGVYVPLAILAAPGICALQKRWQHSLFWSVATLTNALLLLIAIFAALTHPPQLYLTRDEAAALHWIDQNTPAHALFLASPEMGSFIPGYTGRRVFYGHPFETIHAQQMQTLVENFFRATSQPEDAPLLEQTDYIFIGPRENALGGLPISRELPIAYQNDTVTIYQFAGK
ncbi:MAG: hypothetical protein OHK0052_21150 [Anaerolineales bacterium]